MGGNLKSTVLFVGKKVGFLFVNKKKKKKEETTNRNNLEPFSFEI